MPMWILDKEIEIIHELGQRVLAFEETLSRLSDVFGELDRLFLWSRCVPP